MKIKDDEYRGPVVAVKILIIIFSLIASFLFGIASKYLFIMGKTMEMSFIKVLLIFIVVSAFLISIGFIAAIIACVVWKVND